MSRRAVLITIVCLVLAAAFLSARFIHATQAMQNAFANEATYAELSTAPAQTPPSASTSAQKVALPIVVYHIVRPSYPNDDASVRAIAVTPETFDAEMNYLRDAGYEVVRFSDLEHYFSDGTPLPRHPVILSFDDAWGDQFMYAFPILQKYHYPATFFVFTNAIGRPGFLSWDDLRDLVSAGMVIGSHSESHPFLTRINDASLLWGEIDGSKRILEQHLGISINEFAYPFGNYNPAIAAMVQKAGYLSARGDFFSGEQASDRLYELSAFNAATTTEGFARTLPRH